MKGSLSFLCLLCFYPHIMFKYTPASGEPHPKRPKTLSSMAVMKVLLKEVTCLIHHQSRHITAAWIAQHRLHGEGRGGWW